MPPCHITPNWAHWTKPPRLWNVRVLQLGTWAKSLFTFLLVFLSFFFLFLSDEQCSYGNSSELKYECSPQESGNWLLESEEDNKSFSSTHPSLSMNDWACAVTVWMVAFATALPTRTALWYHFLQYLLLLSGCDLKKGLLCTQEQLGCA